MKDSEIARRQESFEQMNLMTSKVSHSMKDTFKNGMEINTLKNMKESLNAEINTLKLFIKSLQIRNTE